GNTYTDFWNILIPNQTPTITASATSICPGTAVSFTADLTGINYQWQLSNDPTFSTILATGNTQNWNYTFTTAGTYYVRHRRYTDCCGWSSWAATLTITVHPIPAAPTASGTSPVCRGAALVFNATAPAGVTFEWYTAASGGTLAGTGPTITIPFTTGAASWPTNYNAAGTYTLYVEAVSAQGCRSSRTPVTINVNQIPAPTASNVSRCGPGQVVLSATYTGSGTPTYNWWDAPSGGTLLQTGGSNTYLASVTTTTTFYVSVVVPGCVESARTPITVTVTAAPATDTWTGAVSTDWFTGGNWQSGCVPNCGTSVTIPAGPVNQPVIGFNLTPAACNSITIANGASLTFSAPNAELQVCGHFNHDGALNTASGGRVRFIGSGVQNYTRSATATGNFYQVIIDKGAAPLPNRRVEVTSLPMVITNQLHFVSGRIGTTATNHVEITNSNPVSITGYGTDNYVMGRLIRAVQSSGGLYAFPVGDRHESENPTNKGYQLAEVNLTGPLSVTSLRAFFTPTAQTVPSLSELPCGTNYICALNNGFWTVEVAGGTGNPQYNLTLYSRNYTACTGHPYYSIYKRNAGPWFLDGTCASPSTITQTRRNGLTGFSDFVVVGSSTPLPIASLTLTAQAGASGILLEWRPDREENVASYELLRSTDLERFERVAVSAADGGPYRYLDVEVRPGRLYYYVAIAKGAEGEERLRSNVAQAVLAAEVAQFGAALQPNPTRNGSALLLSLPEGDSLEIWVFNSLGQLVWLHRGYYEAGNYRQHIPSGEWSRGLYAVEVRGRRYSWSGKLMRE
ncbi:MAG: PKD domain-containing protein, partial [Bacteroidia bacterium]|nr:PKD domain-containing protein [Bacteroidia bacterium]